MRKAVRLKLAALEKERELARARGRSRQEKMNIAHDLSVLKKSKGIKTRSYLIEYYTIFSQRTGPTGP